MRIHKSTGNEQLVALENYTSIFFACTTPAVGPQLLPIAFNADTANQGDSVSVACSVLKGDMPMDIMWAFGGEPVRPTADQAITVNRINKHLSTLSIDNVAARHAGEYTCTASNVAGSVSRSTILTINGTPLMILSLVYFFGCRFGFLSWTNSCTIVGETLNLMLSARSLSRGLNVVVNARTAISK